MESKRKTGAVGKYWFPVLEVAKLDYLTTPGKPLTKSHTLFSKLDEHSPSYHGKHAKKTKKENVKKNYYLKPHSLDAYFAYQILLRLGIHAPKARIVIGKEHSLQATGIGVGTARIDIIALLAVRHGVDIRSHLEDSDEDEARINQFRKKYKLDINKQIILNLETEKEYKIDSEAFGSYIAAILLNDEDFIAWRLCNFGFIEIGERFVAAAIDKETTKFDGGTYAEHKENCKLVVKEQLFKSAALYPDQHLAIVHEISQAMLISGETKECDFDRIFCNSRVVATPELAKECKQKCENLKKTAQSILDEFKDELPGFYEREVFRKKIAGQVIAEIKDVLNPDDLIKAVIKDLRGPYYQTFFVEKQISAKDTEDTEKNKALIEALVKNFKPQLMPLGEVSLESGKLVLRG